MLQLIWEALVILIAVAVFIPICIKKYQCNDDKYLKCKKCGHTFGWYWFMGSTGYCPDCHESFTHETDNQQ